MTCARYVDLDFVERYVLGQMDEAEQATFEAHYFECPDCFAAVQALQTTQSVLREAVPQAASPTPAPQPTPGTAASNRVVDFSTHPARAKNGDSGGHGRSTGPRLLASSATWVGLAAAASLAGMLIWSPWRRDAATPQPQGTVAHQGAQQQPPSQPVPKQTPARPEPNQTPTATPSGGGSQQPAQTQPGQTPPAQTLPAQTLPAQTRPLVTLEALALVTPPPYIPLQTRGADGAAAFSSAMTKYAAKDYRGAIDGLKPIVEAQPEATHAAFFLGVSYLAAGDAASASATLNRVAASNVAPFADEAHFYLAKLAIRAHDLDRAERELSLAIERQAGPAGEAAKLLQAVRSYRREHSN